MTSTAGSVASPGLAVNPASSYAAIQASTSRRYAREWL